MGFKGRIATSWPISTFWVILSVSLALIATYSFLQADWIVKRSLIVTNYYNESNNEDVRGVDPTPVGHEFEFDYILPNTSIYDGTKRLVKVTKVVTAIRFGTIGVCASSSTTSGGFHCQLYNEGLGVSALWPMVTILGGSGCVTLCVSAVLSLLAVALPSSKLRHRVATTIGHAQTVAVVLLFMSLLIFPLGFNSDFVRYHCGSSVGPFNIGDCEIGWAYALVLVCASLALYCPVLVKFTADVHYDSLPKYL